MFKPNYMPKKYAVMILPIVGVLISLAALVAVIEDTVRFRRGTFQVAGGIDPDPVERAAHPLNHRPRKCPGMKTPNQAFSGIAPPVALRG